MYIKTLDLQFEGNKIVTDIDDCLIDTTAEIKRLGLKPKTFWFTDHVYEKYKHQIFLNAPLTPWGEEFFQLIRTNEIEFELLTAARNRLKLLVERFNLPEESILENYLSIEKAEYLNAIQTSCLYVDDDFVTLQLITNSNITKVNYSLLKLYKS